MNDPNTENSLRLDIKYIPNSVISLMAIPIDSYPIIMVTSLHATNCVMHEIMSVFLVALTDTCEE